METQPQITITEFVSAFRTPGQPIHLRTFKPREEPETEDNKARKFVTSFEEFAKSSDFQKKIREANKTKGVFFVVNSGGHTDAEITQVNSFFVESDSLSITEQHERLDAAPLLPSIRVETKKSVHAYWLLTDEDKSKVTPEMFRLMQSNLVKYFDGDEKCVNPSRVMRLPYLNHVSFNRETGNYEYKQIALHTFEPNRRYTFDQMLAAFAPVELPTGEQKPTTTKQEFSFHEDRNDFLKQLIRERGKATRTGYQMKCPAHSGTGESSLFSANDSPAVKCLKGCDYFDILAAFGLLTDKLPSRDNPKVSKADDSPLKIICLNDVRPENISWLWFPYIAKRKLTLISGEEGLGKSWLACAFAAAVSTGNGFPPNFEKQTPGNVLMLSAEDGLADTIKPRLISCGADTSRIFAPDEPITFDEKGLLRFEMYVAETQPELVTVDPLFAYTPGKVDVNSANQSRSISAVLAKIAEKYECAIALIRHIGKSKGFGDPRAAGLGSIDWRAAVRSELLVGKNPDNEQERAIVHTKSNLAEFGESLGFLIENSATGAALRWTGKSELTAACILSSAKDEDSRAEQSDAVEFLTEALREGERLSDEVRKEAQKFGVSDYSFRKAKTKLGVKSDKKGGTFGGDKKWYLSLPTSEDVDKNKHQHLQSNADDKYNSGNSLAEDVEQNANQHLQQENQHLQREENAEDVENQNNQHLQLNNSKQRFSTNALTEDVEVDFSDTFSGENKKTNYSIRLQNRTEFANLRSQNRQLALALIRNANGKFNLTRRFVRSAANHKLTIFKENFMIKPVIKQKMSSGNKLEIFLERKFDNFWLANAEWSSFPPSQKDMAEYRKLVQPRVVKLAERLQQSVVASQFN